MIKKYIYLTIIFGLSAFYSNAQEPINPDSSEDKKVRLDEVVISANKVFETKKTVSQQVQVLTAKEIANSQSQSTADLLSNTGNVFIQKSQQGGGSVSIRGFEASRNVLIIDGIRMNNLIYRAGHLQNIISTDNNIMDRVEILYGPASTIYGSDALGGAVVMFTKKPVFAVDSKDTFRVNVMTRFGSVNNESTSHFDFNFGTQKLASLTSFTYSNFGDLMGGRNQNPFYTSSYGERPCYVERFDGKDSLVKNSNRYLQVGSAYNQYDFMQKFLYKQNNKIYHGLNFQYSNSGNVNRYDRLTDPKGAGLKSAEWYYGPQERLLAAYDLNYNNMSAKIQNIHFGLNYQSIEESRHDRKFGNDIKNHRIENVGVLGMNLDFQKMIKAHNIRFGIDGQYNTLKSTANSENILTGEIDTLDTRYPDGDNMMMNVAAFISHTWKINEELVLTDGIRAGYSVLHSTLIDTATLFHLPYTTVDQKSPVYSGNIGLIHSPSDDLKFSMMLSSGFRVPNVDDMSKIFESSPGTVIVPNVNLRPERTVNYEMGITKIFEKKTKWETCVYYTQFVDAIVTDVDQFNGQDSIMYNGAMSKVFSNQNKGEAYLYGLSTNMVSQLDNNFSISTVVNYNYGRIKTDTTDYPLDHIAPLMARLQLSYARKKFSSDFFINYNGWKRLKDFNLGGEDNEVYATPDGMPAWYTLNFRASYKIYKHITIQAGIYNMLDIQYRTFASGINAPGRNVFVTLRGNF